MATSELTEAEREFATHFLTLFGQLDGLREQARALKASGGDPKNALLSMVESEQDKRWLESQWPMLAFAFGL